MPLKYVENWTQNAELIRRPSGFRLASETGGTDYWRVVFYQPGVEVDHLLRVALEVEGEQPAHGRPAQMPTLTPKINLDDGRSICVTLWQPTWAEGQPTRLRIEGFIRKT